MSLLIKLNKLNKQGHDIIKGKSQTRTHHMREHKGDSMLNQLKSYAGNRIFTRGAKYYAQGCIHEYKITRQQDDVYEIKATVQGTYQYTVHLKLSIASRKLKIIEGFCNCPYDWGILCKHKTAVLYKFLAEDYPRLATASLKPAMVKGGYDALKNIAGAGLPLLPSRLGARLTYELKGLKSASMVNFRLRINSADLKAETIETMLETMARARTNHPDYPNAYNQYLFEEILDSLSGFDRLVVEQLRQVQTRISPKNQVVFFKKTKENLGFLLTIIEQREVYQEGSPRPLQVGEVLKPQVHITGGLERLEVRYEPGLTEDEGLYHPDLECVVNDDLLHLLDTSGLDELPPSITVPAERQGEFLFEVLPQLEKRFRLQLDPVFKKHHLTMIKPEISLDLDYQDEMIICNPRVKINNTIYENKDSLKISKYEGYYEPLENIEGSWLAVHQEMIKEFFRFFDENGFTVSKEGLVIKDQEAVVGFMLKGKQQIPSAWQVTFSPEFTAFKVSAMVLEPIVEVNMDDSIDWFEFKIYYNLGGQTYTHQEIRKMMRVSASGERYIKLGNNLFMFPETERVERLDEALRAVSSTKVPGAREELYNIFLYQQLLAEQGIKIHGNKVYNEFAEEISHRKLVETSPLPNTLHGELRDYQKEGYYWLSFLHRYHLGGILADDMGLGKTIQVLTLIASLPWEKPFLVVAPRSLIHNWAAEIEKFYPDLKHLVYYGTPQERRSFQETLSEYKVVITTYDTLNRDAGFFQQISFAYCILDEAQHIKNYQTQRAKMVKEIKADHRLVITGTPIENNLAELWSLFDFLMPGFLGSQRKFTSRFGKPIKDGNQKALALLKQKVSPFILRRRKEEVLQELPEKVITRSKVFMTKLQADTYQTVLSELKERVMASVSSKGLDRSRFTVLAALTKLRQICNHPRLVLPDLDPESESGKVEALMELLQAGIDGGHKIVVFSQFVKMLKIIEERLGRDGIPYEYLDGRTKDRMARINHFNEDHKVPVFLISLKAGGVGINLTSADIVIHVDPWWNPMVENQATDRVHRIGQKNQVMVYKLITIGTVEEKMLKLQAKKNSVFDAVIERNQNPVSALTWEDLKALFD